MPIITTQETLDKETYSEEDVRKMLRMSDKMIVEHAQWLSQLQCMIVDLKWTTLTPKAAYTFALVSFGSCFTSFLAVLVVSIHLLSEKLELLPPPQKTPQEQSTTDDGVEVPQSFVDVDSPQATFARQENKDNAACYPAFHNVRFPEDRVEQVAAIVPPLYHPLACFQSVSTDPMKLPSGFCK